MSKISRQNMASLQNEEQTHILDAIDEMRNFGVNEDISIPQVCLTPKIITKTKTD